MTMIKGNEGGVPTLDNIDLTHAQDIECEKCGGKGFRQTMMLKKLSSLMSPTGQEAMIPIEVFSCGNCGKVPDSMMPRGDE